MKKIQLKLFVALLGAALLPLNAYAGAESGIYLGAGLGDSRVEGSKDLEELEGFEDLNFDSTGYKLLLGYNFGVVPLIDLALEGAYVNFGEESLGSTKFEQTSWNGFGLAGLSFGPVGLFGKAGMAAWDTETSVGSLRFGDSGTDPVYGVGARLQFGSIAARIEYEYYDQEDYKDVSMTSVSLLYTL